MENIDEHVHIGFEMGSLKNSKAQFNIQTTNN